MTNFLHRLNHNDHQLQDANRVALECLIEASARAMVKRHGSIPSAIYLQGLADTCAVEQLLPIAHWQTSAPKAEPVKRGFVLWVLDWLNINCLQSRSFVFIVAFCAGWWWGIFTG